MKRQQKEAVVSDFKEMFDKSKASFLVNYKGLDVKSMSSLRRALRENGGRLKITKARLIKIACKDIDGIEPFSNDLKEQIGLVFAVDQVPVVAKQIVQFSKDNKSLQIVSGFFESKVLSKQDVEFFASLPSREVLFGQLAGTLQAPIAGLARVLMASMQQLVYVLSEVAKKNK